MKQISLRSMAFIVFFLMLCISPSSYGSQDVTLGFGTGALYSGLGINVGLRSEDGLGYIAAGCPAIGYSDNSDWQTACGAGAGWVWTNLLSSTNNRHGLGLYVGAVGYKGTFDNVTGTVYGAGVSYTYFFRGVDQNGWNLGGAIAAGDDDGTKSYLLLQAGYQF